MAVVVIIIRLVMVMRDIVDAVMVSSRSDDGRRARRETPAERPMADRAPRREGCLHGGGEDQIAHAVLRRGVSDRAQQREAAPFAVDAGLAGRERHVPSRSAAPLPDCEADQLQARERAEEA